ncbi:hypothetical protein EN943_16675 [Mesorhizobium sp. M7A.F.Ca.US.006.01.1.1]|nr:hypothetical protein EN943_16675 [Mesorhizobium sp. M7A.F.Ca.US.006.01.1.1]
MFKSADYVDVEPLRALARNAHRFVIHGRSKERSDAAQTRGSMPRLQGVATVQNFAPLHPTVKVTEWIPGSPRRSFAPAPPRDDEVERLQPISNVGDGHSKRAVKFWPGRKPLRISALVRSDLRDADRGWRRRRHWSAW